LVQGRADEDDHTYIGLQGFLSKMDGSMEKPERHSFSPQSNIYFFRIPFLFQLSQGFYLLLKILYPKKLDIFEVVLSKPLSELSHLKVAFGHHI
jgi:hypothetical protein